MNQLTRNLGLALAATAILGAEPAHAVCQIPLAIGQNTGNANVLILLDNSGSMNEVLVSSAYNPNTRYSGDFDRRSTYDISSSGTYSPRNFRGSWPNSPTAYLVTSDQGEAASYSGNYLNWIFYNATSTQRAAIPTVTRIQSAKQTVASFLSNITDCRLGLEVFDSGSNGGTILANIGTSSGSIGSTVSGIRARTMTPLAEAMCTAMTYFSRSDSGAPIQAPCQKSFVVVVTDGLPTSDTNVPSTIRDSNRNGYYLDEVATYLYRNDLRPDMDGIQNVSTFTIGFNIDHNLLQLTADNGGGEYFPINDGAGLSAALTSSFNTIAARVAAGAAVSVVSSEDRSNNRLFRARYESQTWRGYLESFALPYHAGARPLWDAGALLAARSASSRNIYTSTSGTSLTNFTTLNAGTLQSYLGSANSTAASNLITFIRGDSVAGSRSRNGWKLGDIVDPAPVMVGKPAGYSDQSGFAAFRTAQAGRREVLYVAANDGMLHCFDVETGAEQWAYIPKDQLPRLADLMDPTYCHNYYLNMTPAAYDIKIGTSWRTYLIGGEAQGGNGLFALDVTSPEPDSVRLKWDVSHTALKGAWYAPSMVRDRELGRSLFVIGTGYDGASAQANLLVIDPLDGSILRTIALGTPAAGNKVTKTVTFDRDFDGYEDLLYAGDLLGNLWRVDLTTSTWTVSKLFSGSRPIQAPPILSTDELGRPMIYFGTGRFLTTGDPANVDGQRLYGIIDNGSGSTLFDTDIVNQTSNITPLTSSSRGWMIDLGNTGERVTRSAALISGILYIPTFAPTTAACAGGGQSWLYSLDFADGSAPDHSNGTENNTTTGRNQSMGDGILADPTVDLVNEQLILQSSNAVLLTEDISVGLRKLMVRSWRQKWN
ncbi:MAG: PilC/PilY family type IV pilus protein [Candidatus Eisenbacteria bacterium]